MYIASIDYMPVDDISITLDGLGHLIADRAISVPTYQRSYAWEEKHVRSLLQDLGAAIRTRQKEYFLGSVVAARVGKGAEVVDGQQRLATAAILLAAIRDYFARAGDNDRANQIESSFLITKDFRTQEPLPRLALNSLDRDFSCSACFSIRTNGMQSSKRSAIPIRRSLAGPN
ncbi:MAG: DUF262 domain-containing protein [Chthoniobacterales bacterium]|nr:DUF262 domain-containing protein [Chthoniobacterales bacterium]